MYGMMKDMKTTDTRTIFGVRLPQPIRRIKRLSKDKKKLIPCQIAITWSMALLHPLWLNISLHRNNNNNNNNNNFNDNSIISTIHLSTTQTRRKFTDIRFNLLSDGFVCCRLPR